MNTITYPLIPCRETPGILNLDLLRTFLCNIIIILQNGDTANGTASKSADSADVNEFAATSGPCATYRYVIQMFRCNVVGLSIFLKYIFIIILFRSIGFHTTWTTINEHHIDTTATTTQE